MLIDSPEAIADRDALVDQLRAAFESAVRAPEMADVRATLRINGFLERDLTDYGGLAGLAELW